MGENDELNKSEKLHVNNTSGYTGVYFNKRDNKWYAQIIIDSKHISLGTFQRKEDAIQARKAAEANRPAHKQRIYNENLTGKTFGQLKVIEKVDNGKSTNEALWRCQCSCGAECFVLGSTLKRRTVRNVCDSSKHMKMRLTDFVGKEYGYLKIEEVTNQKDKYGNFLLRCRCLLCGGEKITILNYLKRGLVKSCGCIPRELYEPQKPIRQRNSNKLRRPFAPRKNDISTIDNPVGVHQRGAKWYAFIVYKRKFIHLGVFDNIEDAIAARNKAVDKYHEIAMAEYEEKLKEYEQRKKQGNA